jgi:hypothetical protein
MVLPFRSQIVSLESFQIGSCHMDLSKDRIMMELYKSCGLSLGYLSLLITNNIFSTTISWSFTLATFIQ